MSSDVSVCSMLMWQLILHGSLMMNGEVGDEFTDNGGVGSVRIAGVQLEWVPAVCLQKWKSRFEVSMDIPRYCLVAGHQYWRALTRRARRAV